MRQVASHFDFVVVIALYRNFILFKKVGRTAEYKNIENF